MTDEWTWNERAVDSPGAAAAAAAAPFIDCRAPSRRLADVLTMLPNESGWLGAAPLDDACNCSQRDVLSAASFALYRYVYPWLLVVSLVGNVGNVLVYRNAFLRDSPTVRLLLARALANLCFCLCVLPNFLYAAAHDDAPPDGRHLEAADLIARTHWFSLRYVLLASNALSTVSVWLTVAVTAEHYALVVWPMHGRQWSKMRNANWIIAVCCPAAALLHVFHVIARRTIEMECAWSNRTWVVYLFVSIDERSMEKCHFWLSLALMHVVPLLLLVYFSLAIYSRLFQRGRFRTNSEQKQCVTRLALATTGCHLIFEVPQSFVFVSVAIYGSNMHNWRYQDVVTAAANFLSLANASIPFIVYLACSRRFRYLALMLVHKRSAAAHFEELHQQATRGSQRRPASIAAQTMQSPASDSPRRYTVDSYSTVPKSTSAAQLLSMRSSACFKEGQQNLIEAVAQL